MADAVGEVFKTEKQYEKMTVEELSETYSDHEVKLILQKVFGLDSVVYFIDKSQKLTYITQPDQRPKILEAGESKRAVHRESNRENRSRPRSGVADRMEEETSDRMFRFKGAEKRQTTDAFTGRSIRTAYVIEDLSDGAEYDVSRGTARWLVEKGRLEEFVANKGRKTVAHAVGKKSAADLLGDSGEVLIQESVEQVDNDDSDDEETVQSGGISDEDLDALLNTLSD